MRSGFGPAGLDANWSALHAFIQAGQYDQASVVISRIINLNEQGTEEGNALLRVVFEICQACQQSHREAGWYEKTWQEALAREKTLHDELINLLGILFQDEESSTAQSETNGNSGALGEQPFEPDGIASYPHKPGFFHRLRDKLVAKSDSFLEPHLPVSDQQAIRHIELVVKDDELQPFPIISTPEQDKQIISAPKDIEVESSPKLIVHCLGAFRVYQDDQPVLDWSSGKSKSIFKYLITHRQVPVIKDVLMDLFWPDIPPEAARNNLNVAIYGLRQTLRKTRNHFSHILFMNDAYQLNPSLTIWLDCDEFKDYLNAARRAEKDGNLSMAIQDYCAAEELYQGEFLEEDRYEDWPVVQRQRIQDEYLNLLERLGSIYFDAANYSACISACRKILDIDPCREQIHRQLMLCYAQSGLPYLAMRQFHLCVEALTKELDIAPSSATKDLYLRLRRQD